MELIYYWINDYRCIHEQGFCLSPEYNISMLKKENGIYEVKISTKKTYNVFASNVISNVTVLVGDNGAGKSTFLNAVSKLNCYPFETEGDNEYQQFTKDKNKRKKNLIIIRKDEHLHLYTNILEKDIIIPEEFVKDKTVFYVNDNPQIAQKNIRNNEAYCGFTKLYISNSYFDNNDGLSSHGTLDDLVITPARLKLISDAFFNFIYPELTYKDSKDKFDLYSEWLKENKKPRDFQQICDLLFYNFLICTKFIENYEGFVQTKIRLYISSVYGIVEKSIIGNKLKVIGEIKSVLDLIGKQYVSDKAIDDPIYVLKSNFIFEWCLKNGTNTLKSELSVEEMYSQIINEIDAKNIENLYFIEAIGEINKFSDLLKKIPSVPNVVPKSDLSYKPGKETKKYSRIEISKAAEWKNIIAYIEQRVKINKEIREGKRENGSFLLRYLHIDNLMFSSGERAFQNLMSWMYFLSQLDEYMVKSEHHARKDMIVCLDEVDLSLHPAWQRDFINHLTTLINHCYTEKNIQIIMTTHSPLCLSDFPRQNIIYLKKTEYGTEVDHFDHKETFGTNLYEIFDDAFYLGNNSMGLFAKKYIGQLIKEISELSDINEETFNAYYSKIECIGDMLIKNKLRNTLINKLNEQQGKAITLAALDKEIELLKQKRKKIMEKNT